MTGSGAGHHDELAFPREGMLHHGPRRGSPVLCPMLIGRSSNLDLIERLAWDAREGRGSTLLIAGEAGVGKSRLVAEARERLDLRVLQGHCFEPDRRLPFAPLVDLLRSLFTGLSSEEIADQLGPTGPEIAKLLPELSNISPTPQLEPEQEERRLIQALLSTLAGSTPVEPTLIVIEDIHWSDATSLEFLLHLARRIANRPILLVLTYRSDETNRRLDHFLANLDRERLATEITLNRLDLSEVDVMLRTIFDQNRPLRPDFLQAMWTLTEGNPFFLEEVLKSLVVAGDIFYSAGGWTRKTMSELRIPRSVQDAVQQRVHPLRPEAQRMLVLAAVAGRRFNFSLLQELSGHDEAELLGLIKELIGAQLVIEESSDRFAFRHALTRQAIYGELLSRERRSLHVDIAIALERIHAGQLDAHVADLAYHFHEGGSWQKAVEYSIRAGKQAAALYSPHAAIEHFRHAIVAFGELDVAPDPDILRRRGRAHEWVGDFDRARQDYEAALAAAVSDGNRRDEWQALIDLGILWSGRDYERGGEHFEAAHEVATAIGDPLLLAHSLNRVGNWQLRVGESRQALRSHREALSIFESQNDHHGVAETLNLLGMAFHVCGDLPRASSSFGQAVSLFRELDDRKGLVFSLATMAVRGPAYHSNTVVPAADLAEAADDGEAALDIAREIGWRAGEAYALVRLGFCLGAQGSYGRALDAATEGLAIAEEIQHRQWMAAAHCGLGAVYADLLDGPTARRQLEPALALGRDIGSSYWFRAAAAQLASAWIVDRKLDDAEAVLRLAVHNDTPVETLAQRLGWHVLGELALARGDPERALDIADRLMASSAGTQIVPRLSFLRGRALLALNRATPAQAELAAALAVATRQGAQPLVWRLQIALGLGSAAQTTLERLAATITDQQLRDAFLQRAGFRKPQRSTARTSPDIGGEFEALTPRERDVAALVAQGMSNRTIADELMVSERTVETHVSNILGKLCFSSRAQIAAWVVRSGLSSASG